MTDRAERTFALLRYSLGGDRPSQTTHHTVSPTRITGISTFPPRKLAPPLQRVPPILHKQGQSSV
jgi:hypothetical protein